MDSVQKIISTLMERGILLEPSALEFLRERNIPVEKLFSLKIEEGVLTKKHLEPLVIDEVREQSIKKQIVVNKRLRRPVAAEYESSVLIENRIVVNEKEKTPEMFVRLFEDRYRKIRDLLLQRAEFKDTLSINKIQDGKTGSEVSVIGIVNEIIRTRNNNRIVEIEDPTGRLKVFLRDEAAKLADYVVRDEVIGLRGRPSTNFFYASSLTFPDVPIPTTNDVKRIREPLSAVFISDLHYGSKEFIKEIESKFLEWINSRDCLAERVKYIFIAGDLVDGIGVYPEQENDLVIKDIYDQYELLERFIEHIPEHIDVILCPGNHDAVSSAEPQPPLNKDLVPLLTQMRNVHLASNPAYVNIHSLDGDSGITVLMYHGYSFTSVMDEIVPIRRYGAREPQHIMKEILRKRHLAPMYGSIIQAASEEDLLVIDKVPDIFHTGDLHSHCVDNYKGITCISSSTFQAQTSFMDRIGHVADPGKITVVHLDTRETEVLNFYKKNS